MRDFTPVTPKTDIDLNNNNIPDYQELLSSSGSTTDTGSIELREKLLKEVNSIRQAPPSSSLSLFKKNPDGSIDISGLTNNQANAINQSIDEAVQLLGCGFGGGSCLSLPMNWAPLAPGSAPVVL